MMTQKESHDEFCLLTNGIVQDSVIDVKEARALKRWLEERQRNGKFGFLIDKLDGCAHQCIRTLRRDIS